LRVALASLVVRTDLRDALTVLDPLLLEAPGDVETDHPQMVLLLTLFSCVGGAVYLSGPARASIACTARAPSRIRCAGLSIGHAAKLDLTVQMRSIGLAPLPLPQILCLQQHRVRKYVPALLVRES
jgi:hypothetical protein